MKEQPFRVAAASQRARDAAQPGFPADRVPIGGWPFLPVGAAFALAWVVFSWPWLSGAVTIPWDAKAHFQPQVQFLAASLARGDSPFWTPYIFAGHPQIADPQSLIFSPPMLLLALVDAAPGFRAVDATLLLTVLASGFGVLLVARDLGWHWAGGLVAALGFTFGASMAWRLQHIGQVLSLAYLPFALLFLKRALERCSAHYGLAAGLIASFIVLGRDQVGLLCVYLLAGHVLWHWSTARPILDGLRRSLRPLAAGAAGGLLVAAIPLLLTILLAAQSNRPAIDFIGAGRGSLHPALLLTTLIPHLFGAGGPMEDYWGPPSFTWNDTGLFIAQNMGQLYIGAAPILLLLAGATGGLLWQREIRFFSAAAIFMVLYALGWYTPAFRAMYELLPGVGLFRRPADATFLIGALTAMLAGYVTHRLFTSSLPSPHRWQRIAELGVVAAAFALAVALALRFERLGAAAAPILIAAAWIAAGALAISAVGRLKRGGPKLEAFLLVALTTMDLAWNNGPNSASALLPSEIDMLKPTTPNPTIALLKAKVADNRTDTRHDRVELAGLGFHWPNASQTHGLEHTLGYNPIRLRLYSDATGAGDTVGLPDQRKFTPLFPSYRSTLADLLGLRFIATGVPVEQIDPRLRPGDLNLLARTPDGYVYENPRAMPRVLFATASIKADFERLIADGRWPDADLATTVLLATALPPRPRPPGTVRILSYRNTEVVLEADSPEGGWVVLNDVWHPWWFAEVDGVPTVLLRANVLFRAVEVPAGRHTVRMSFRPLAGALDQLLAR